VLAATPADSAYASNLGQELGLPVLPGATDLNGCTQFEAVLLCRAGSLSVQRTGRGAPGPVSVDFGNSAMRHRRRAGHNELLGRAVGVTKKKLPLHVLDATAGLGRDAFVLADLGCDIVLCERELLIARMLQSGLQSAAQEHDPWLDQVLARMQLVAADAMQLAPEFLATFDVIYLDPMFPGRDKSAAVKKEMAIFQLLLGSREIPGDADELLHWALSLPVDRIVVKRPARATSLAKMAPSHAIAGKAVRYDVYQRQFSE